MEPSTVGDRITSFPARGFFHQSCSTKHFSVVNSAACAFPELKVLDGTNLLEKRLQVVLSWVQGSKNTEGIQTY